MLKTKTNKQKNLKMFICDNRGHKIDDVDFLNRKISYTEKYFF